MQKFNLKEAILCFAVVLVVLILLLEPRPTNHSSIIHCMSNLKQISLAVRMYSQENEGFFPDREGRSGFEMLRAGGYLVGCKDYICPFTTDNIPDGTDLTTAPVSYTYVAGLKETSPPDTPVARDKLPHKNYKIASIGLRFTRIKLIDGLHLYPYYQYGSVLFVDGHVEECQKERWEEIIRKNNFTY